MLLKAFKCWWIMSLAKLLPQTVTPPRLVHLNGEECEPFDWTTIFGASSVYLTLPGSCLNHIRCLESCHVLKRSREGRGEHRPGATTRSGNTALPPLANTWKILLSKHRVPSKPLKHYPGLARHMNMLHGCMCLSFHNWLRDWKGQWYPFISCSMSQRFKVSCSKLIFITWGNVKVWLCCTQFSMFYGNKM